jgi:hypothetical protein
MTSEKIEIPYMEDYQMWEKYKKTEIRWVFNKLEVALKQGLDAGPAGTAPSREGYYIYRPTYNPYGMGIGAKKFFYSVEMYDKIVEHDVIPPGHFWCEWLEGPHLSIDYRRYKNGMWWVESVWQGEHISEENLTKFSAWKRLKPDSAPNPYLWGHFFPWLKTKNTDINGFNIETRSGKIIEVHLRLGNDLFEEYEVGTTLVPIWEDQEIPKENFVPNKFEDMELVYKSGYLKGKRKGYKIIPPGSKI